MLDRASTFADPEIVQMLKTRFVPVAIDQWHQRRQKDSEGEFYRKIAGQGPRNDFQGTTQGFYVATPSGELLFYNNNRNPEKLRGLMKQALATFDAHPEANQSVQAVKRESIDKRFSITPPADGVVLRVHAKVLGGYEPTDDRWLQIFQSALSRDNMWLTAAEQTQIAGGVLPDVVKRRLARFHLVDNTRGEPPMWEPSDLRELDITLHDGVIRGTVLLQTNDSQRGYEAELKGHITAVSGKITRMDIVALGEFWGDGPYVKRGPKGRYPFAVSLTLADGSDIADQVPPQGARGWLDGYLR